MSRFTTFLVVAALALASGAGAWLTGKLWLAIVAVGCVLLVVRGVYEMVQTTHSLARNYPLIWAVRYFFESVRPQIRQYLIESDTDGEPFDRVQRSLAYQRAKNANDMTPFGTEEDVRRVGYEWINPSIRPAVPLTHRPHVEIGGPDCQMPYSASLLNISAMSFGSLGAQAVLALNKGAKIGGFAHDSGEGGLSRYHLEHGGDLIWEFGSGYFGCRTADGRFDRGLFRERAALEQVKMIEIKLSQGAKPGHGGVLPAAKVSPEIAITRGIPAGADCVSPPRHSAFDSPVGLMEFIALLREESRGKPVGFKLCIGHRWEFLALCKAMLSTGIYPDFIVIDGKEGGTGAAPSEFINHVGTPLREGLMIAVNALVGCGIRDRMRIGASGKIISGFDMAAALALGADWCNSARGFMFALGCLQSQKCHTNRCPVGVATQDPSRQRGLVVDDKAERVASFHRRTIAALVDIIAAAGVSHPGHLEPGHVHRRVSPGVTQTLDSAYEWLEPGQLVDGTVAGAWFTHWQRASPDHF